MNKEKGSQTEPMTVLVIQGRKSEHRVQEEQKKLQGLAAPSGVQLQFVNPLLEDDQLWTEPKKLLKGKKAILFTGSADLDLTVDTPERNLYVSRVSSLAKESIKKGSKRFNPLQVFGICLGHQLLHQVAGGKVERDASLKETGTGRIRLTRKGVKDPFLVDVPLTKDMQEKFGFFEIFAHKDTVVKRGKGFKKLGGTERDKYSLTRKRGIFTTQGHPEITDAKNLQDIVQRANQNQAIEGYEHSYPLTDTPGADMLLVNFFNKAAS